MIVENFNEPYSMPIVTLFPIRKIIIVKLNILLEPTDPILGPADPMTACIEACIEEACISDVDLQDGCNQMFSCSHGCQMRALGLDNETCVVNCDRNGQSGCSPEVNGYTFNLCAPCSRERCPKLPTVAECKVGCNNYGGMYHLKNLQFYCIGINII